MISAGRRKLRRQPLPLLFFAFPSCTSAGDPLAGESGILRVVRRAGRPVGCWRGCGAAVGRLWGCGTAVGAAGRLRGYGEAAGRLRGGCGAAARWTQKRRDSRKAISGRVGGHSSHCGGARKHKKLRNSRKAISGQVGGHSSRFGGARKPQNHGKINWFINPPQPTHFCGCYAPSRTGSTGKSKLLR